MIHALMTVIEKSARSYVFIIRKSITPRYAMPSRRRRHGSDILGVENVERKVDEHERRDRRSRRWERERSGKIPVGSSQTHLE